MLRRQLDRLRLWLSEQLPAPTIPDRPHRRKIATGCAIVFLIAFTIRLLYWHDASAEIARGDSTIQALANPYRDEVRRMLDTGGVLYPQGNVDRGDARVIAHPPGYSVMMAAVTLIFGDPDAPLRLAQILLAAAQAVMSETAESDRPVLQLGRADLFLVGATPYQWTRYPRSVIRGIQKNLYKTEWMWLLIIIGVGLLVLAGRERTLLILLAVPAYYLIVHSALHTEYRYILAIHYFLFICAAATFYVAGMSVRRAMTNRFSLTAGT